MRAKLLESRVLQALPIALLLILTAWGNALAMFAISTLALLCAMLLFSRDGKVFSVGTRTALISAGAAFAVAVLLTMWES